MYTISRLFLLSFFLIPSFLFGQVESKVLSPSKMEKDLDHLLKVVEAHPDPYTKISKEDFQSIVKQVQENIKVELDEIDFYKNLSQIIASIEDGHSSINMPQLWMKNIRKENGVFPYELFLSNDGELFVTKSFGDKKLPLGAQILEINQMPVEAFINAVSPHLSYETIPFRNDRISESFEFLLYLIFKTSNGLTFKFKGVEEKEAVVNTMPYKDWKGQKKDLKEEREKKIERGEPYDFMIVKDGIAKIDIFSFAVYDIDKYNLFLNKTFNTIKKNGIHSLIIDVRGNYGGWPKIASELFHYIHDGHFKTMAKSSMKISSPYRNYYFERYPILRSPEVDIPKRRHYVNLDRVINAPINSYENEDIYFNEAPITENHEFNGDCFLLIDRKSYSASSSFASTFQCYSMGYIVGEPTGGTKIFRANAMTKMLPKSNFILRMSTTKLYTACFLEENESVLPNVESVPTMLDRIHNVDSQLNTALLVIKKLQKAKKEVPIKNEEKKE